MTNESKWCEIDGIEFPASSVVSVHAAQKKANMAAKRRAELLSKVNAAGIEGLTVPEAPGQVSGQNGLGDGF